MRENVIDAPPELQEEISRGLAALKKNGYRVAAKQSSSGELDLDFQFGATEQKLKFTKDEWQKKGTVEKRILDKLDI
jgi:hypothetical protein